MKRFKEEHRLFLSDFCEEIYKEISKLDYYKDIHYKKLEYFKKYNDMFVGPDNPWSNRVCISVTMQGRSSLTIIVHKMIGKELNGIIYLKYIDLPIAEWFKVIPLSMEFYDYLGCIKSFCKEKFKNLIKADCE